MRAAVLMSAFVVGCLCAGASASSRSLLQAIPPQVQGVVTNYSTLAAQQVLNATNGNQGAAQVAAQDAANAANDAAREAVAAGRNIGDILDSATAAAEVSIAQNVANTTSVLARSQNQTITPFNGSISATLQSVLQQAGANASQQILANGGNRTIANTAANQASQAALRAYNDAIAAGASGAAALAAATGASAAYVDQLRNGTLLTPLSSAAAATTDTVISAVNQTLAAVSAATANVTGLNIPGTSGTVPTTNNSIPVNVTEGGTVPPSSPAGAPAPAPTSGAAVAGASTAAALFAAVLAVMV